MTKGTLSYLPLELVWYRGEILRYTDDYLILIQGSECFLQIVNILKLFKEKGMGLKFACEMVRESSIQFLDIVILRA